MKELKIIQVLIRSAKWNEVLQYDSASFIRVRNLGKPERSEQLSQLPSPESV